MTASPAKPAPAPRAASTAKSASAAKPAARPAAATKAPAKAAQPAKPASDGVAAPALGSKVAAFTAESTGGTVRLADLKGRIVVLYFYPKDNTPGCTTETADFGSLTQAFEAAGATVFGVSRDSLKSHHNFKTKLGLDFELISDPDEALCRQFGVIKQKNMYGRQVLGIERSTFVIDSAGRLVREWRGVKVTGHAAAVLAIVQGL